MRQDFGPTVYLLASRRNGTLYLGVTSNILQRIYQHREGLIPGFMQEYGVRLPVSSSTPRWTPQYSVKSGSRNGTARGSWS